MSSSSLIPASLITNSANFDSRASEPRVDEQKRRWERLHAPPGHHEIVACNPERNRHALAQGRRELLQACRVFPAQREHAVRQIEGREEMVEKNDADNAVDPFRAKALGELAQG